MEEILKKIEQELKELFSNNDKLIIEDFYINEGVIGYDIIPRKPYIDEDYCGELDDEIKEISDRYGIKIKMVYWCYPK